tara:strand:- start:5056 stop:5730 length:675 start_codon:yes stop_codon:yes gene_type:complete
VPKRLNPEEKRKIADDFKAGKDLDQLSMLYRFSKQTISKYIISQIGKQEFDSIRKNSNFTKTVDQDIPSKIGYVQLIDKELAINKNDNEYFQENIAIKDDFPLFTEVIPLTQGIELETQKELSSESIYTINFPDTLYMIVDKKIELETKELRDYPDWSFLPEKDLSRKSIELFVEQRSAKRNCSKNQKVLKIPNTNIFKIVARNLVLQGITRLILDDNLISLEK